MRRTVAIALAILVTAVPAASSRTPARCLGIRATLIGTGGSDRLTGTDGRDVIVARGGADLIQGRGGRDLICAGGGHDVVEGGEGADIIFGGSGNDRIDTGLGTDVTYGGAGDDSIEDPGRAGGDTLSGGEGNDRLDGGAHMFGGPGNDQLFGRAGAPDLLMGGPGLDVLDGGLGVGDTASYRYAPFGVGVNLSNHEGNTAYEVVGGDGSDQLRNVEDAVGSSHDDVIAGNHKINRLWGLAGDDRLLGGAQDDAVSGGPGDDEIDGGTGSDIVSFQHSPVGVVADLSRGTASGEGTDRLAAIEDLKGSAYEDTLTGDDGPNRLEGWHGPDHLFAAAGDDFLSSGDGDAGAGTDECLIAPSVTSCERHVIADPGPGVYITSPGIGSVQPAGTLTLHGEARQGFAGHVTDGTVYVSMTLTGPDGCASYRVKRRRLMPSPCSKPRFERAARFEGDFNGSWSYLMQNLPAGDYQACASIRQGADARPICVDGFFGPAVVDLRLE